MVRFDRITMAYSKNYNVLQDLSFDARKGEATIVHGEIDSGKTSLLRIALGIENRFEGACLIDGTPVHKVNFKDCIGALYISKRGAFLHRRSVNTNMRYILKLRKQFHPNSEIVIANALKQFSLYGYKDNKIKSLSTFHRALVQLARASLRDKIDLICVDDVFMEMNDIEKGIFINHLAEFATQHKATMLIAISSEKVATLLKKEIKKSTIVKVHLGQVVND